MTKSSCCATSASSHIANITWRRQDNGETFSSRTATVFHLDAGRVIEVWALDEDPEGFDEFVEGAT